MTDTRTRDREGPSGAAPPSQPGWLWSQFARLSPRDVYDLLSLRQRVFIVEQNCAYQDADGRDAGAWHLLGRRGGEKSGGDALIAYARVFEPGVRYEEVSIGRIVTAPEVRGSGLGRLLLQEAMRRCDDLCPGQPIRIAAQRHLEKFYEEFGFTAASEPYDEDGILHIDMLSGERRPPHD